MIVRYPLGSGQAIVFKLPGFAREDAAEAVEDLHFCRLGMKFRSPRPLPEFMEYAFGMDVEGDPEPLPPLEFHGIVVESEPDAGGFRVAIHFCQLDEDQALRLDRYSRRAHLRCDHCGGLWQEDPLSSGKDNPT